MERQYECPLCLDIMAQEEGKAPVFLKCNHSICLCCFTSITQRINNSGNNYNNSSNSAIDCPICQDRALNSANNMVFQNDISELIRRNAVQTIITTTSMNNNNNNNSSSSSSSNGSTEEEAAQLCGHCEREAAKKYCHTCGENFCEKCAAEWHKKGAMAKHVLVAVASTNAATATVATPLQPLATVAADEPGSASSSGFLLCSQHPGEKLTLYCRDDNQVGCSLCFLVGAHKNHDCVYALEAAAEVQARLAGKATPLRESLQQLEASKAELEAEMARARATRSEAEEKVVSGIQRLIDLLNSKKRSLLAKIADHFGAYQADIEQRQRACGSQIERLTEAMSTLDSVLAFFDAAGDLHARFSGTRRVAGGGGGGVGGGIGITSSGNNDSRNGTSSAAQNLAATEFISRAALIEPLISTLLAAPAGACRPLLSPNELLGMLIPPASVFEYCHEVLSKSICCEAAKNNNNISSNNNNNNNNINSDGSSDETKDANNNNNNNNTILYDMYHASAKEDMVVDYSPSDSDDSFIDKDDDDDDGDNNDTECGNEHAVPAATATTAEGETNEKEEEEEEQEEAHSGAVQKVVDLPTTTSDVSDNDDSEEEEEEDAAKKLSSSSTATTTTTNAVQATGKQIKLHADIEEAIEAIRTKVQELKKEQEERRVFPKELEPEFLKLAEAQRKHYPRGIPTVLLDRLSPICWNFAHATLKEKLKQAITQRDTKQAAENLEKELASLKDEFLKKITKEWTEHTIKQRQQQQQQQQQEVLSNNNNNHNNKQGSSFKVSEEVNSIMNSIFKAKLDFITNTNNLLRRVRQSNLLDEEKEMSTLFSELAGLWPTRRMTVSGIRKRYEKWKQQVEHDKKKAIDDAWAAATAKAASLSEKKTISSTTTTTTTATASSSNSDMGHKEKTKLKMKQENQSGGHDTSSNNNKNNSNGNDHTGKKKKKKNEKTSEESTTPTTLNRNGNGGPAAPPEAGAATALSPSPTSSAMPLAPPTSGLPSIKQEPIMMLVPATATASTAATSSIPATHREATDDHGNSNKKKKRPHQDTTSTSSNTNISNTTNTSTTTVTTAATTKKPKLIVKSEQ